MVSFFHYVGFLGFIFSVCACVYVCAYVRQYVWMCVGMCVQCACVCVLHIQAQAPETPG